MQYVDFVGLVVIQCEHCGQKFVVEATKMDIGFSCACSCNRSGLVAGIGTRLHIEVSHVPCPVYQNKRHNREIAARRAMPLNEYKRLLSEFIITGKKPRIPKEHSKVVSIETDKTQYQSMYETLRQFGFSKDEAFAQIDVALKEGLYMETEMIKYILTLNEGK